MYQPKPSLSFCLLMDLLGYATYALPLLGEFADLVWAPLSAIIFYKTFGGWKGSIGGIFNLLEELLPGTDFIPSFTLMWWLRRYSAAGNPVKAAVMPNGFFRNDSINKAFGER